MKALLQIMLLGLVSSSLFAADELPSIESLMTESELRATGVSELSADQIEALNAWLVRFRDGEISEAIAEAPASTDSHSSQQQVPDVYPPPRESIVIESRIDGELEGWTGKTRFLLQNGQIWEQRRRGRWKVSLMNPEVRLTQNFLGAWEMEVVSEGRSIGVRRLR